MEIIKLFSHPTSGAAGIDAGDSISINTPVEIEGRVSYRSIYYLRFAFDSVADGLRIKTASSQFSTQFDKYTLYLTEDNDTFQTQDWQVEEDNDLIKVHLTHPWRLEKVRTYDYRGIDVLRLDGEAVAEEATVKANTNVTLGAEFIAQDFAIRRVGRYNSSELTVSEQTSAGRAKAEGVSGKGAGASKGKNASKETLFMVSNSSGIGTGSSVDISDGYAIDDVAVESFGIESAPAHMIKSLQLKSVPTGQRIMLGNINEALDDSDSAQLTSFWQLAGEQLQTPVQMTGAEAKELLPQLQTLIDRYIAATPRNEIGDQLFLPITFESDTPSLLKLNGLAIEYKLLKTTWDHWSQDQKDAGKETVRFPGDQLFVHALQLNLPLGTAINQANLRVAADIGQASGFAAASLASSLNQAKGVSVTQGSSVAKGMTLDAAMNINRVAVALMPVTEHVIANVELVADVAGKPMGSVLARGSIALEKQGERSWVFATLDQSALVDIGLVWLRITCNEGALVWLADDVAGKVSVKHGHHFNQINNLQLLAVTAYALDSELASTALNIQFQVNDTLSLFASNELDGLPQITAPGVNLTQASYGLVSPEAGTVTLYGPDIEYQ